MQSILLRILLKKLLYCGEKLFGNASIRRTGRTFLSVCVCVCAKDYHCYGDGGKGQRSSWQLSSALSWLCPLIVRIVAANMHNDCTGQCCWNCGENTTNDSYKYIDWTIKQRALLVCYLQPGCMHSWPLLPGMLSTVQPKCTYKL